MSSTMDYFKPFLYMTVAGQLVSFATLVTLINIYIDPFIAIYFFMWLFQSCFVFLYMFDVFNFITRPLLPSGYKPI